MRKALALIALERFPEARKVILEALELEPENLFLKKTLTEIDLKLPVSSFESFMLHYSGTKDMRVRLCCLVRFGMPQANPIVRRFSKAQRIDARC